MELIWTQDEIFDFLDEQKRLVELEYKKYALYQIPRERFQFRGYEGACAIKDAEYEFKEYLWQMEQLLKGQERLLLSIDKKELRDLLFGMLMVRDMREAQKYSYPEKPITQGSVRHPGGLPEGARPENPPGQPPEKNRKKATDEN